MCLGVVFFLFVMLETCFTSWIFKFTIFVWFSFNDFGEKLAHYFFQLFFCPISFLSWDPSGTYFRYYLRSLRLYLFFSNLSFVFRSDNVCWPILKFTWPYFVIANLWLSPFNVFVVVVFFFLFQISYYLFLEFPFGSPLIVSVFLQDFPLCSFIFNRFYFISLSIIII